MGKLSSSRNFGNKQKLRTSINEKIHFNLSTSVASLEDLFDEFVLQIRHEEGLRNGMSLEITLNDKDYMLKFITLVTEDYKTEVGLAVLFYQWFLGKSWVMAKY
jgi:hypothetical protein